MTESRQQQQGPGGTLLTTGNDMGRSRSVGSSTTRLVEEQRCEPHGHSLDGAGAEAIQTPWRSEDNTTMISNTQTALGDAAVPSEEEIITNTMSIQVELNTKKALLEEQQQAISEADGGTPQKEFSKERPSNTIGISFSRSGGMPISDDSSSTAAVHKVHPDVNQAGAAAGQEGQQTTSTATSHSARGVDAHQMNHHSTTNTRRMCYTSPMMEGMSPLERATSNKAGLDGGATTAQSNMDIIVKAQHIPMVGAPHHVPLPETAAAAATGASSSSAALNPTDIDVIFGRGEPTRRHPGNVILRDHVSRWLKEYMNSTKSSKSAIIRRVVQDIDSSGARYLVPLDPSCRQTIFTGGCREASKAEVRSKVSHAFRDGERRALTMHSHERDGATSDTIISQKPAHREEATTNMVGQAASRGSPKPPTPTTTGTATAWKKPVPDLLSFANILTSLKNNTASSSSSSPTELFTRTGRADALPPSSNRLEALTYHASTGLSSMVAPTLTTTTTTTTTTTKSTSVSKKRGRKPKKNASSSASYTITQQQQEEQQGAGVSRIVENLEKYCREIDIVFGRGAPLRQHPGNMQFRTMVSQYNERYAAASKHEKTAIIQQVIREIQDRGAKFLIMEDDGSSGVAEASSDEIRMKVSHRFRDFSKGGAGGGGQQPKSKQQQGRKAKQSKLSRSATIAYNKPSTVASLPSSPPHLASHSSKHSPEIIQL